MSKQWENYKLKIRAMITISIGPLAEVEAAEGTCTATASAISTPSFWQNVTRLHVNMLDVLL